jgi:hypothetical protein
MRRSLEHCRSRQTCSCPLLLRGTDCLYASPSVAHGEAIPPWSSAALGDGSVSAFVRGGDGCHASLYGIG